jgi:hypothetical protein
MRHFARAIVNLCWLLPLLAALTGCVSKSKADAQARAAFLAGQREEMQRQSQAHEPAVTVLGAVRNGTIPWTPELTLVKAIAAADYYGAAEPGMIIVVRAGRGTQYDPKRLLSGEDVPLQPQDIVLIR